jgi:hypothetical protein
MILMEESVRIDQVRIDGHVYLFNMLVCGTNRFLEQFILVPVYNTVGPQL